MVTSAFVLNVSRYALVSWVLLPVSTELIVADAVYQGDHVPGDDITIARKLHACRVNGISSIGIANSMVSANILSFRRLLSAHFCKQGSQLVFRPQHQQP